MSVGGYLKALKEYIAQHDQLASRPYRLSQLLTLSMGVILNLGTVPIIYRIAEESSAAFHRKKMGLIIQRAFGLCAFWSPYFVNIGLLMTLFGLSWAKLVGPGFLIALVYLLCAFLFNRWLYFENDELAGKPAPQGNTIQPLQTNKQKLRGFILWVIGLFALSFTLDLILAVSMLTIVSLLALVYPLVWAAAIGSLPQYIETAKTEISRSYVRLRNELAIFISAGFFGEAISHTSLGENLSELILSLSFGSVYVMSILLVLLTILLALTGIHPVIVLIGVGSSFQPHLFGVSPVFMAVLLLIAWTLAIQLSTFSGSVLMTAHLTDTSPWLLVRKNLLFIVVLLFILPLVLYVLF